MIKDFPADYKTPSDVLRAGVFALAKWKHKYNTEKNLINTKIKKCGLK